MVKVRVFSLTRETKAPFLDFVFCFLVSLMFCFGRAELGGDGVFLCRQKSAVGQTQLWNTQESSGNLGEHSKAGVMILYLFQHAVRVSLTFT